MLHAWRRSRFSFGINLAVPKRVLTGQASLRALRLVRARCADRGHRYRQEWRGYQTFSLPCTPVSSEDMAFHRITAGQDNTKVRSRRAPSAGAWGRCHLVLSLGISDPFPLIRGSVMLASVITCFFTILRQDEYSESFVYYATCGCFGFQDIWTVKFTSAVPFATITPVSPPIFSPNVTTDSSGDSSLSR